MCVVIDIQAYSEGQVYELKAVDIMKTIGTDHKIHATEVVKNMLNRGHLA